MTLPRPSTASLTHVWGVQKAVATRLLPEDMVSTVFIFSDMEFDVATTKNPYYPCSSPSSSALSRCGFLKNRYGLLSDMHPREEEQTNFASVKVCAS